MEKNVEFSSKFLEEDMNFLILDDNSECIKGPKRTNYINRTASIVISSLDGVYVGHGYFIKRPIADEAYEAIEALLKEIAKARVAVNPNLKKEMKEIFAMHRFSV